MIPLPQVGQHVYNESHIDDELITFSVCGDFVPPESPSLRIDQKSTFFSLVTFASISVLSSLIIQLHEFH